MPPSHHSLFPALTSAAALMESCALQELKFHNFLCKEIFFSDLSTCKKSYTLPADVETKQWTGRLPLVMDSIQTAVVMCFMINWEESGQAVN